MKRRWAVLIVLLGAVLIIASWWYYDPAARPGWLAERLPTAPGAEVELYRWQGADGQWHLSSEPPPAGTEYETVRYRHDTNVLPPVETE